MVERTDPEKEQAAYFLFMEGTTLKEEGNLEAATQAFERALQFDPNSTEIRMSLGECYFTLRRFERAIAIVEASPVRDRRVIEFLGRCHRFLGHDNEAEEIYRLTSLCTFDDRFVIPPMHREEAIEMLEDPMEHKQVIHGGDSHRAADGTWVKGKGQVDADQRGAQE